MVTGKNPRGILQLQLQLPYLQHARYPHFFTLNHGRPSPHNQLHSLPESRKWPSAVALWELRDARAPDAYAEVFQTKRSRKHHHPQHDHQDTLALNLSVGGPYYYEAPHFINHTHLSFIAAQSAIDTETFTHSAPAILDLRTGRVELVRINIPPAAASDGGLPLAPRVPRVPPGPPPPPLPRSK